VARPWLPADGSGGAWGPEEVLAEGGFGYAVAPSFAGNRLAAGWFQIHAGGLEFIVTRALQPSRAREEAAPQETDSRIRWKRWRLARITPPQKPRESIVHDGREYRIFWADTHCHSVLCPDAEGEPDDLIRFARDIAGLDAVCLIDNGWYPPKSLTTPEWGVHQVMAEHFTKDDEFVAFCGYEFSWHRKDAAPMHRHRTIMFPRPGGPLLRRIDPETPDPETLFQKLRGTNGFSYIHHCEYDVADPRFDRNTEVCSSWRICIEENDCTLRQLAAGHRLGFIGSSDTHRMVPGLGGALTGIIATELTPEALVGAYQNRRLIATSGAFVFLDVRVAGALPGQQADGSGPPAVEMRISAPEPIETVHVFRDAEAVREWRPGSRSFEQVWTDDQISGTGLHSYFVRVKLVGDPSFNRPDTPSDRLPRPFDRSGPYGHNLARARGVFAWSSPAWVRVE
jgi:hypothetical protein